MKQHHVIEAMAQEARARQLIAKNLWLLDYIDEEEAARRQAFAEGAEAALLWVLGNIKDIGFPPVQLTKPTDISDADGLVDSANRN